MKAKVWPRPCEGCGKPATKKDSKGVPLCRVCYKALMAETYPTGERRAAK